jgi:hypothetical protein
MGKGSKRRDLFVAFVTPYLSTLFGICALQIFDASYADDKASEWLPLGDCGLAIMLRSI